MADSSLDQAYLDAIKNFEGFTPRAQWDYGQYSVGYGTKATHPGEVIDQATADARFRDEISKAQAQVDARYPELPPGARAALTSLTYNAGPGWMKGALGEAVASGDWTAARDRFLQYNKAGGQVLPGLVNRRVQEAAWLTGAQQPGDVSQMTQAGPLSAASLGRASTPAGVPLTAPWGAGAPDTGVDLSNLMAGPSPFQQFLRPMRLAGDVIPFPGRAPVIPNQNYLNTLPAMRATPDKIIFFPSQPALGLYPPKS